MTRTYAVTCDICERAIDGKYYHVEVTLEQNDIPGYEATFQKRRDICPWCAPHCTVTADLAKGPERSDT